MRILPDFPRAAWLPSPLLLTMLVAFGSVSAPAAAQAPESLLALRALDQRVAAIGYRLATANTAICGAQSPAIGFVLHHRSQYDQAHRGAAARAFGLGAAPSILAVAEGSAAARAGLQIDDQLLSIDGTPLSRAGSSKESGSFEIVRQSLDIVEAALADGQATVALARRGQPLSITLEPSPGCPSRFQLVPGDRFGASADGQYVQVTTDLVLRVEDDAELAAVLAHELAHNILKHRARLDEANVSRGILREFGRNAGLIRTTETEADLLSVYLLDRAGYPPEAAARFWERFGPQKPWGIFGSATHPNWKRRAAALREEIGRLHALRQGEAEAAAPQAELNR